MDGKKGKYSNWIHDFWCDKRGWFSLKGAWKMLSSARVACKGWTQFIGDTHMTQNAVSIAMPSICMKHTAVIKFKEKKREEALYKIAKLKRNTFWNARDEKWIDAWKIRLPYHESLNIQIVVPSVRLLLLCVLFCMPRSRVSFMIRMKNEYMIFICR